MIDAYQDGDAPVVSALLKAAPEVASVTAARLRAFAAQSFNRGGRDFRVVRRGGRVVAFMSSTLMDGPPAVRHARIVVHPEHRRQGLATRLLQELQRQPAPPGTILQGDIQASWEPARELVGRQGFTVVPTDLLMHGRGAPGVAPPEGVTLREATARDDAAWMALHEHGYGHREDFTPLTRDDLAIARQSPGFTLLVAEAAGRAVGLCHGAVPIPTEGFLHSLVVEAGFRRRGVGSALTAAMLRRLRAKGATDVFLRVAVDDAPAITTYQRLGFTEHDRILRCRRPIG